MTSLLTSISIERRIDLLAPVVQALKSASSVGEKRRALGVSADFAFLGACSEEERLVVESLVLIGQAEMVLQGVEEFPERVRLLLDDLLAVERFYSEMGGIVGYHWMVLQALAFREKPCQLEGGRYLSPEGVDISEGAEESIAWGITHLSEIAEIYPLGGAADRLRLQDANGVALPAAKLLFCGKTLLEGLVADLQAREYLHYKLFGKQLVTPIAMMTSKEKGNDAHIQAICEEKGWFGRPKESFRFFCQPLVPAVDSEGNWCLQGPLRMLVKPGGHGVIWKLARDQGIFEWLFSQGRQKVLVRQINNPIAGTDQGLLAFAGLGCREDKWFGFSSCPRQVKASEGMNVLVEREHEGELHYVLTNIEYCDFEKYQIADEPAAPASSYSKFPSNTNILFADLKAVLGALARCPVPGLLINLKKTVYTLESGETREGEIARLESTMQNIADSLGESRATSLPVGSRADLKTFLTYNKRRKTISTTKREFSAGNSLLETPEGCFLDMQRNAYELLSERCSVEVPEVDAAAPLFGLPPSFIFLYHPALGPLYSIIAQKIRGGRLARGSELQLEIAEICLENFDLDGSLSISAEALMGKKDAAGILRYGDETGKCILKNVKIRNQGIDRAASSTFWKNAIVRKECCQILLRGNGEFYAEDVTLEGDLLIEVQSGERVRAVSSQEGMRLIREPLAAPSWRWHYIFDEKQKVILSVAASP